MVTNPRLTFARGPVQWSAARALLGDYGEWLAATTTVPLPESYRSELRAEVDDVEAAWAPPHRLLLAWIGPVPVGTLGARHVDESTAELARCFVRPIARGQAIAHVMLGTMISHLRREGARRIVLETAPTGMAAAHALYRRFGFTEVEGPRSCAGVVAMELALHPCGAPERAA
jgi:GNAT superfamily N-acetyltransferase